MSLTELHHQVKVSLVLIDAIEPDDVGVIHVLHHWV